MPELPEVETVRKTLELQMGQVQIVSVDVLWPNIIAEPNVEEFKALVKGQTFLEFKRIGKYLIFELSDYHLIAHLRMEGKFFYDTLEHIPPSKHSHVIFHLDNQKVLVYHDVRKFGKMYLYPKSLELSKTKALENVGYDAFDPNLTAIALSKMLEGKRKVLKTMLLDQHFIAGIGNIYADEICFRLKRNPAMVIDTFDVDFCQAIIDATHSVLSKAVEEGGTTIRSYTSSLGVSGRFQLYLQVHMREGETCYTCNDKIKKTKVGGRGTYYCPTCQHHEL